MRKPRGLRLNDDTMTLINRLARVQGRAGYEVVEMAVAEMYERLLMDSTMGPALQALATADQEPQERP